MQTLNFLSSNICWKQVDVQLHMLAFGESMLNGQLMLNAINQY